MNTTPREQTLRSRIRLLTCVVIVGLIFSGVTAIPLVHEVNWLVQVSDARHLAEVSQPAWAVWIVKVESALQEVSVTHPFLFYGTDWLAFGHFVIALSFVGALLDPVRNRWLFNFGMIACASVVPYAITFGALHGIPFWWRLIDCSFGIVGFIPLWFCRRWAVELEEQRNSAP